MTGKKWGDFLVNSIAVDGPLAERGQLRRLKTTIRLKGCCGSKAKAKKHLYYKRLYCARERGGSDHASSRVVYPMFICHRIVTF
jgi:hypothetical protein